jgi:hypothetical protein
MAFLTEQYYYLLTMPSKPRFSPYPVLIGHGEAEPGEEAATQ